MELCERDEDGADLASLNVFKVLLFIIRYELTSKRFTRAWMTMGRAITLAKMMNLYQMDSANSGGAGTSDPEIRLPPLKDPASLEEMRRSFWTLYIFESYASVRTGRLFPLAEAQVCMPPSFQCLDTPGFYYRRAIVIQLDEFLDAHIFALSRSTYRGLRSSTHALPQRSFQTLRSVPHLLICRRRLDGPAGPSLL